MRGLRNAAFLLFAVVGMSGGFCSAGPAHYKKASVCAVLANPKLYLSSYVAVDAGVFADGMHGIILTDKRCPDQGLPLDFPQTKADKSVSDFEKATTGGGSPGTAGRLVFGKFVGKVRRDPARRRILYSLLSVQDLSIESLPAKTQGAGPR